MTIRLRRPPRPAPRHDPLGGSIIAILGAVLGLAVGLFFGWTVVRASRGIGITAFTLAGGQLVLFVVAAALAGILAAILPGRRAARVDLPWAISTA